LFYTHNIRMSNNLKTIFENLKMHAECTEVLVGSGRAITIRESDDSMLATKGARIGPKLVLI